MYLVDPPGSSLYGAAVHGVAFAPQQADARRGVRRHRYDSIVEGVGCDRVTANFAAALPLLDGALRCSDAETVAMSRYLARCVCAVCCGVGVVQVWSFVGVGDMPRYVVCRCVHCSWLLAGSAGSSPYACGVAYCTVLCCTLHACVRAGTRGCIWAPHPPSTAWVPSRLRGCSALATPSSRCCATAACAT